METVIDDYNCYRIKSIGPFKALRSIYCWFLKSEPCYCQIQPLYSPSGSRVLVSMHNTGDHPELNSRGSG